MKMPIAIAAAAWWGLSIVGTGQPVRAQPPANAKSAAGRVEGGSDFLSLGASATGTIAELLVHAGAHVQAGLGTCAFTQATPGPGLQGTNSRCRW